MKRIAGLVLLALEIVLCGCGASNNTNSTTTASTSTTGNWEAQLTGGTGQSSLLNFVVSFSLTNSGPLSISGFAFFNAGSCFGTGTGAETESGSATLATGSTGSVTGTLNLTVTASNTGTALTITNATLTGTSNGTTTTTGTLSNGVVVGTWTLTPGATASSDCLTDSGTFVMCQGKSTCSVTPAAAAERL